MGQWIFYIFLDIFHDTRFQSIPSSCTIFKLSHYLCNFISSNRIHIEDDIGILRHIVCWVFGGQRDSFCQGGPHIYKKIIKSIGNQLPIFHCFTITDKFSATLSIFSFIDNHFNNVPRLLHVKIVDHSDTVGSSLVGTAPTTSSFST